MKSVLFLTDKNTPPNVAGDVDKSIQVYSYAHDVTTQQQKEGATGTIIRMNPEEMILKERTQHKAYLLPYESIYVIKKHRFKNIIKLIYDRNQNMISSEVKRGID